MDCGCVARHQDEHGVRLGEAGQVVEITVEAIGVVGIAIAYAFLRGRDDGDAALHGFQQAGAAFGVGAHVHGEHG